MWAWRALPLLLLNTTRAQSLRTPKHESHYHCRCYCSTQRASAPDPQARRADLDVQDNAASPRDEGARPTQHLPPQNFTDVCPGSPRCLFTGVCCWWVWMVVRERSCSQGAPEGVAKTEARRLPTRLFDVIVAATHDPIPGTVQTDSTLVSCSNSEGEDVYA